jgi:BirA family biotin operon repressor/biotin-[acetyl-CoA-carboxylase] ligase
VTDIRRYEVLDSTNEEVRRRAANGETGPLWVIARSQTKGRGRRGRNWISVPGNLFTSLLIELGEPAELCGQLSFVAALAVADLTAGYASGAAVTLKWPNDVLLNGRKVAGILLEVPRNGTAVCMIIGFGVNLARHPGGTDFPAISFAEVSAKVPDPEVALLRLVDTWNTWYEIWREDGFRSIRTAWLARAEGLGKELTVQLGNSVVAGVFENIDEDGSLRLRVEAGKVERITAGDVFFIG